MLQVPVESFFQKKKKVSLRSSKNLVVFLYPFDNWT